MACTGTRLVHPARAQAAFTIGWSGYQGGKLAQLVDLAIRAGAEPDGVSVQWEPEGVNLFLHVKVA